MPPLHKPAYVRSTEHNLLRIYDTPPQEEALPSRLQNALDRLRAHSMAQDGSEDSEPGARQNGTPMNGAPTGGRGNASTGDAARQPDS